MTQGQRKAIFLDRDGTIIIDRVYLNDPEQIEYLPGVFAALRLLRDQGFEFFIATNQSGIPRGLVDLTNLEEIHRRIRADFARKGVDIRAFHYAPHLPSLDHRLRKPNPGMLLDIAVDYNIDCHQSWMIGDKMTDVEAGHRAGCRSILLGSSDNPTAFQFEPPEGHFEELFEAAEFITCSSRSM